MTTSYCKSVTLLVCRLDEHASDEEPPIVPTSPDIRALPWKERMQALGMLPGPKLPSSTQPLQSCHDVPAFRIGDDVEAHSLAAQALNGERGQVVAIEGERFVVSFSATIGKKALTPLNLKYVGGS